MVAMLGAIGGGAHMAAGRVGSNKGLASPLSGPSRSPRSALAPGWDRLLGASEDAMWLPPSRLAASGPRWTRPVHVRLESEVTRAFALAPPVDPARVPFRLAAVQR